MRAMVFALLIPQSAPRIYEAANLPAGILLFAPGVAGRMDILIRALIVFLIIFAAIEAYAIHRNPFKLPLCWIGLLVGLIPVEFFHKASPVYWWIEADCREPGCGWFIIGTIPFVYFYAGWLLHVFISMWRSYIRDFEV